MWNEVIQVRGRAQAGNNHIKAYIYGDLNKPFQKVIAFIISVE